MLFVECMTISVLTPNDAHPVSLSHFGGMYVVCVCVCVYACMHACIIVYAYVCMLMCMCVCVYIISRLMKPTVSGLNMCTVPCSPKNCKQMNNK